MIPRYLVVALLAMFLPITGLVSAGGDPCENTLAAGGGVHQAGAFYVDVRSANPGNVWIYQETNQIDGLERGGYSMLPGGDHDRCVDFADIRPDQLIY